MFIYLLITWNKVSMLAKENKSLKIKSITKVKDISLTIVNILKQRQLPYNVITSIARGTLAKQSKI